MAQISRTSSCLELQTANCRTGSTTTPRYQKNEESSGEQLPSGSCDIKCNYSHLRAWSEPFSTLYFPASPINLKWEKNPTSQTRTTEAMKAMEVLQSYLNYPHRLVWCDTSPEPNQGYCNQTLKGSTHDSKADSCRRRLACGSQSWNDVTYHFWCDWRLGRRPSPAGIQGVAALWFPEAKSKWTVISDLFNRTLYKFHYFFNYEIIHRTIFPSSRSS